MNEAQSKRNKIKNIDETIERLDALFEHIRKSILLSINLCFKRDGDNKSGQDDLYPSSYQINPLVNRDDVENDINELYKYRTMLEDVLNILELVDTDKFGQGGEEHREELKETCSMLLTCIENALILLSGFTFHDNFASLKAAAKTLDNETDVIDILHCIHIHQMSTTLRQDIRESKESIGTEEYPIGRVAGILSSGVEFRVNTISGDPRNYGVGFTSFIEHANRTFKSTPIPNDFRSTLILDKNKSSIPVYFDEPTEVTYFIYRSDYVTMIGIIEHYDKLVHGDESTDIRLKLSELPANEFKNFTESDLAQYDKAVESIRVFTQQAWRSISDGGNNRLN